MENENTPHSYPSPLMPTNIPDSKPSPQDSNFPNAPDFQIPLPSSTQQREQLLPHFTSSNPETYRQNSRKKRSKMIKIDSPMVASSSSGSSALKRKYGKKPDPGAPKITRPCSECGKKFWSWKALFGHMRCHPERQWRGINPPPNFRRHQVSPTVRPPSSGLQLVITEDDHEIATCLLMLANGTRISAIDTQCETSNQGYMVETDTFVRDLAMVSASGDVAEGEGPSGTANFRFECSSCNKVFGSHQALGGHRASHKNVKGCFAITMNEGVDEDCNGGNGEGRDGEGEVNENVGEKMGMVLGHRCSICLRVFSSGQALGGHKRCHWEKGEDPSSLTQGLNSTEEGCGLDLTLPAPFGDDSSSSYSSGLTLELRLGI